MAPTRVPKKKRLPPAAATSAPAIEPRKSSAPKKVSASTQAAGSSSSTPAEEGSKSAQMTLTVAAAYYEELDGDTKRLLRRLDGLLWLHQAIGVAVVNVSMYDLDVRMYQLYLLLLSVLWLGRQFALEHLIGIKIRGKSRRLVWRVFLLAGFVCAVLGLQQSTWQTLPLPFMTLVGIIVVLDTVSLCRIVDESTSPTSVSSAIQLIELLFVAATFSTQYNTRPFLIFDKRSIAATLATLVIHFIVTQGTKHAVLVAPWISEYEVAQNQKRRWESICAIRRSLGVENATRPDAKKKGRKRGHVNSRDTTEPKARLVSTVGDEVSLLSTRDQNDRQDAANLVAQWMALQTVTVAVQLVSTAFVVYAWELFTIVMATSVHLLLELVRLYLSLRRKKSLPTSMEEAIKRPHDSFW